MVNRKPKKDTAAMFARLAGQVDGVEEEILTDSVQAIEPQQQEPTTETSSGEPTKQEDQTPMPVSTQIAEEMPSAPVVLHETAEETVPTPAALPKRGRAPGKRSDPNYTQIGAYIPKNLDRAVKRILVDEENLDLSELVAQLLDEWVKRKSS